MANTDNDIHLSISGFTVTMDGMPDSHYETVRGLGISIEDMPSHEKKNQILNKPGRFNAHDITFERRLGKGKELSMWMKETKQGTLNRKSGSVIALDAEEKELFRYNFFDAWPKEYTVSEFSKDASSATLLMERVVLSVSDLEMA